jgi:hypothetical protein
VITTVISYPECHISSRNYSNFTALDYAYSTGLQREFSAVIKEAYEDRRQRRLQQTHTPQLGQGRPEANRNGSFVSVESNGRAAQLLRSRGSLGTLLSDESAVGSGGNRSDISYSGRHGSGPATPPSGYVTPNGMHLTTRSPQSLRTGYGTPRKGEGYIYDRSDVEGSPSTRAPDNYRPPLRRDSATDSQQLLRLKPRSDSYKNDQDMRGTAAVDRNLTPEMARMHVDRASTSEAIPRESLLVRDPSSRAASQASSKPELDAAVEDGRERVHKPPPRSSRRSSDGAGAGNYGAEEDAHHGLGLGAVVPPAG